MTTFEDVKKAWKEVDKKELALDFAKGAAVFVGIGLASIGTIVVGAIIIGSIQQKMDPEGFKQEWLEEMKEAVAKAEKEEAE